MKNVYVKNIDNDTLENSDFRRVIFTGSHLQLVLMNILSGDEIGEETHINTDQFLRIESGNGILIIDDVEYNVSTDFGICIPAGSRHNIINTGNTSMKLYSIYSPPHHSPDTVEHNAVKETVDMHTFNQFIKNYHK